MRFWSLRTRLMVVVSAALLPLVIVAGWHASDTVQIVRERQSRDLMAVLDKIVGRQHELMEGSRRMLAVACNEEPVRRSADPAPPQTVVERCEAVMSALLRKFPAEYSAGLVTDKDGVARCSTSPSIVGTSFADRDIFKAVRDRRVISIGASVASRITSHMVVPVGAPIEVDGQFRGMCSLGLNARAISDLPGNTGPPGAFPAMLVDSSGAIVAGSSEASLALPVPGRVVSAIAQGQRMFTDYGQNGVLLEFRIVPIEGSDLFAVAAAPTAQGLAGVWQAWAPFVLIALATSVVLAAVWLAADRLCARPLHDIGIYAARIARGEAVAMPSPSGMKELAEVEHGLRQLVDTVASREGALKEGLEQRDHMLREIHHRVKNNLQIISSLLNLQAGEIRSPRIRRFFSDAQNRVLTLSILHRHLYERSSWSLVDFQQFISDLVRQISVARSSKDRATPRYSIRAPVMAVGPDTAIPIGLIVTEAVASALDHDFAAVSSPEIRIEAKDGGSDQVELVIEDNGLPSGNDSVGPGPRGGFGLTLIRGLALQLGGKALVTASGSGGIRVAVAFPMPKADGDG